MAKKRKSRVSEKIEEDDEQVMEEHDQDDVAESSATGKGLYENMASRDNVKFDDGDGSMGQSQFVRTTDIGWKYAHLKDLNNKSKVTCNFCKKEINQGINQMKMHLAQITREEEPCKKVPVLVRDEVRKYISKNKFVRAMKRNDPSVDSSSSVYRHEYNMDGDDYEEADMVVLSNDSNASEGGAPRPLRQKGLMDKFLSLDPAESCNKNYKQPTIKSKFKKEERKRVLPYLARWIYQAGVPFNTTKLKSFKTMIEAIGQFGPGLKPPSYHELRVPLLKEEVKYIDDLLIPAKESWLEFGVSIMSDGWIDRRHRSLINFLVNSLSGTIFLKSVDSSSYAKTTLKTFELLDGMVEEVGEKNVMQVITDNTFSYVSAGKMLMRKRPHLYWTPCSAHCIDLMLEDIGGLPKVKALIKKATMLTGFIYNHGFVLNLMRKHIGNADIICPALTRFATSFLTLQCLYRKKDSLRKLFISDEWLSSKWPRDASGGQAENIVHSKLFWDEVVYALKLSTPLVRVLRLVVDEKRPAMGYIYEAMNRAKKAIKMALEEKESMYLPIWEIIDTRWNKELHRPLHAAGYFLNPQFFYENKVEKDKEAREGMMAVITRLSTSLDHEDLLCDELASYMQAEGDFGSRNAIRERTKLAPVEWWRLYGSSTPTLKRLAIKILGLACSASGCERNWSMFEHIHAKKMNRLEQKRLKDLVYINYNQRLVERFNKRHKLNPLILSNIDGCCEWLSGKMQEMELVHGNDNLTWEQAGRATGADEARNRVRSYISIDEVDIQVEQELLPNIDFESDEDDIDEEVYNQELADKDVSDNDVDDIDDAILLQKVHLQSDEDNY